MVLSRICASWLRDASDSGNGIGLSAIPYREDIANLLILKEDVIPLSSAVAAREGKIKRVGGDGPLELLESTDETSITRGFLLVFLSKLPNIGNGLPTCVHKDLLHFIIKILLDKIPPVGKGAIMLGVSLYSVVVRFRQSAIISHYDV